MFLPPAANGQARAVRMELSGLHSTTYAFTRSAVGFAPPPEPAMSVQRPTMSRPAAAAPNPSSTRLAPLGPEPTSIDVARTSGTGSGSGTVPT